MAETRVPANEATLEQCATYLLGRLQDMDGSHRDYENDKAVLERLAFLAKENELVPEHPVEG